MTAIELPIIGQGSQPKEEDGAELEYLQLPQEMSTYTMPDISADLSDKALAPAKTVLYSLLQNLTNYSSKPENTRVELQGLDQQNLAFINQAIGEGEVSLLYSGEQNIQIQESILAGVWRVQTVDANKKLIKDYLEVGAIPEVILQMTFQDSASHIAADLDNIPEGVMNAPPLITELNAKIKAYQQGDAAEVINLSLLPQTEEDLAFLSTCLGGGIVTILSRGYGNCRITSTATKNVWWVQYFNSQDVLILNTLEVVDVPNVACAALEDIEDSQERLQELLNLYL